MPKSSLKFWKSNETADVFVFHTLFGEEYRGVTPEEVVEKLYRKSEEGMNISFPEWWGYQTKLWKRLYGIKIPSGEARQASRRLLKIFVRIGALEKGPLPDKPKG
jgi:hypothetical protein